MQKRAIDEPFGSVISNEWKDAVLRGIASGAPAELPANSLLVPMQVLSPQSKFAEGLAYDVFRLNENWILKVAADRHSDAIAPTFIYRQVESYNFLVNNLGTEYVCATYLFTICLWGRRRGCEIQRFIEGRPLSCVTDSDMARNPILRSNLLAFLQRVLDTYELTGRVPDFWGAGFLKNARYTTNVLIDAQEHPWVIDVGAWPEGFCETANARARIRVWKMVRDLRQFARQLARMTIASAK